MICCGSNTKPPTNPDTLLNEIRKIDELPLKLTLNNYLLTFQSKNGTWKDNFGKMPSPEISIRNEKIMALNKELMNKDKEIDELERQYLAKIAKLLVMAQVHCEIKTEINKKFDELGVSHKTYEEKHIEEVNSEKESQIQYDMGH